jgi:hypothetical protein
MNELWDDRMLNIKSRRTNSNDIASWLPRFNSKWFCQLLRSTLGSQRRILRSSKFRSSCPSVIFSQGLAIHRQGMIGTGWTTLYDANRRMFGIHHGLGFGPHWSWWSSAAVGRSWVAPGTFLRPKVIWKDQSPSGFWNSLSYTFLMLKLYNGTFLYFPSGLMDTFLYFPILSSCFMNGLSHIPHFRTRNWDRLRFWPNGWARRGRSTQSLATVKASSPWSRNLLTSRKNWFNIWVWPRKMRDNYKQIMFN